MCIKVYSQSIVARTRWLYNVSQLNSHSEELAWTCELTGVGLGHEIIVCNGVLCQQQLSLTASAYAFPAKHSVWGSLNATLAYP